MVNNCEIAQLAIRLKADFDGIWLLLSGGGAVVGISCMKREADADSLNDTNFP